MRIKNSHDHAAHGRDVYSRPPEAASLLGSEGDHLPNGLWVPAAGDGAIVQPHAKDAARDLLKFAGDRRFTTVLADPPWRFTNRTGKMAPEHHRLSRYGTLALDEIAGLPVGKVAADRAHLYLWVPNALLAEGLRVMAAWVRAWRPGQAQGRQPAALPSRQARSWFQACG